MMVVPTFWAHLHAETHMAIEVQDMLDENPGACTFRVEDNSGELQREAMDELDALSDAVKNPQAVQA